MSTGASRPLRAATERALSAHLEQLHAIAVGIFDEREAVAALADRVRRLLGLDAPLAQTGERRVDVVGCDRDVPVAGADVVAVDVEVIGQLPLGHVAVAGLVPEDVYCLLA